jgi:ABC-type multidrug transport system ATPase subunit
MLLRLASFVLQGKIRNIKDFRAVIGFVPQDDIMIRELTVRDNIEYSARGKHNSSLVLSLSLSLSRFFFSL